MIELKSYKFFTCDVFTNTRFSGNQLAVVPEAEGLTGDQMQKIAKEFNFSETTFVLKSELNVNRKVRIFTPNEELPFAGHPNIGTACVLALDKDVKDIVAPVNVLFEELAGVVEIQISQDDNEILFCELKAPEKFSLGAKVPSSQLAKVLSLEESEIDASIHVPMEASVGLKFLFINISSMQALRKIRVDLARLSKLSSYGISTNLHCYYLDNEKNCINARMFAPDLGVREDPATGSANCALVGLLAHHRQCNSGMFSWNINQGIEMGRPSQLFARASKIDGKVADVWIGGNSVLVSEGRILLD